MAEADKPTASTTTASEATSSLLLTEEGELSDKFYDILQTVFLKHAKFPESAAEEKDPLKCAKAGSMGRAEMNAFAKATNGLDLPDDQWEELTTYLDVNDDTELTFKGFISLYSLQTENDEAETVKDLEHWGYDPKTLELLGTSSAAAALEEKASADSEAKPE
ncbi:hypothetical protein JCM10908_004433 [Rhodotorula pacifica]|uniref:uncharacterized protein n=1 Tax=Rhodotorula pacifica TaxID=1495444 RepID=UPI003170FD9A